MPKGKTQKRNNRPNFGDLFKRIKILDDVRTDLTEKGIQLNNKNQIKEMRNRGYSTYQVHHLMHDIRYMMKNCTFLQELSEYRLSYELRTMIEGVNALMNDSFGKALSDQGKSSTKWHFAFSHLADVKTRILSGDFVDISIVMMGENYAKMQDQVEQKDKEIEELKQQLVEVKNKK